MTASVPTQCSRVVASQDEVVVTGNSSARECKTNPSARRAAVVFGGSVEDNDIVGEINNATHARSEERCDSHS